MRRVFVALVFAPAAACLFPDLGDLRRDGSSDVSVDDASDVAIADVNDASPVDATDAADAGFCASLGGTHALCEDFDEEAGYAGQFTSYVTANAAQGLDTSASTSSPNSLVVTTPATTKTGDHSYIEHAFTTTASSSITYTFDVRFDAMNASGSCVFGAIILDDGQPDFHVLSVYLTSTYSAVEESFRAADGGTSYVDHAFTAPIALGAWSRVSIALDLVKRTVAATVDGKSVVVPVLLDSSWKPGPPTIDLGFTYVASETQSWQARYDDVVFDFQ